MRGLGSTGRQTGTALLRWLLVWVVLAVVSAQAPHAFASEIGHDSVTDLSTSTVTDGPDHHAEDSCQNAGHCASVFVGFAPSLSFAPQNWGPFAFVLADAPPLHGLTVDPGQHPPKSVQLF